METINIHEAKTHLSRLVEKAAAGESFIIAKAGKPMVQVTALASPAAPGHRKLGFLKGQFNVPDDFKAFAREEIEEMFYGNPDKFAPKKSKK
jgi:prevent-host-death family protein